ncbi:RING-H2 finger protein ATL33 [Diospyros lotus]|uniref:RING-H2 finger protein ATL33 n=1 Tax=Diospyros lotus TaxID=55363 RepID=UPI00225439DE|nr:RING-H2 finger protein ATL33 [Diospyros lotus]
MSTAPPAAHTWLSDSSPYLPIFSILAFVAMLILIYAFFFALKCPPNPFDSFRRSSSGTAGGPPGQGLSTRNKEQVVASITYKEEQHGAAGGECPVCLSAFLDGEAISQVEVCKHLFHVMCIDMWLSSHHNCPVCRALILAKPPRRRPVPGGEADLRQGLPDSANLM